MDENEYEGRIARIRKWVASLQPEDGARPSHDSPSYYELVEELGHGGMGAVFLARKQPLGRSCAVKFLLLEDGWTNNPEIPFFRKKIEAAAERFLREAKIMAGLEHPAIVKTQGYEACYETDPAGRRAPRPSFFLYEMEPCLVSKDELRRICAERWKTQFPFGDDANWRATRGSVSLQTLIKARCSFPQETVAGFAMELIGALRTAHEQGAEIDGKRMPVVHRDIKPSNILVAPGGGLKIADFGISKPTGGSGDPTSGTVSGSASRTMSTGTRGYAAPEQLGGAVSGPEADYYGLGVVLYELLTGRRLAFGTTDPDWVDPSTRGDELSPVSRHWDVLLRGMQEPDPARRLADPDLLLCEFGEIKNGRA